MLSERGGIELLARKGTEGLLARPRIIALDISVIAVMLLKIRAVSTDKTNFNVSGVHSLHTYTAILADDST